MPSDFFKDKGEDFVKDAVGESLLDLLFKKLVWLVRRMSWHGWLAILGALILFGGVFGKDPEGKVNKPVAIAIGSVLVLLSLGLLVRKRFRSGTQVPQHGAVEAVATGTQPGPRLPRDARPGSPPAAPEWNLGLKETVRAGVRWLAQKIGGLTVFGVFFVLFGSLPLLKGENKVLGLEKEKGMTPEVARAMNWGFVWGGLALLGLQALVQWGRRPAPRPTPIASDARVPRAADGTYAGHGLRFRHPRHWTVAVSEVPALPAAWQFDVRNSPGTLQLQILPGDLQAKRVNAIVKYLQSKKASLIFTRSSAKLSGQPALGGDFRFQGKNRTHVGQVLAALRGGQTVVLFWLVAEDDFPSFQPGLDEIRSSLAWPAADMEALPAATPISAADEVDEGNPLKARVFNRPWLTVGGIVAVVVLAVTSGFIARYRSEHPGGGNVPNPSPDPIAVVANADQLEWENKLRQIQAEIGAAVAANNPLRVGDAEKKLESFVASTLTAGKNINGWVGILTHLGDEQTKSGQPCLTATLLLRDFDEQRARNWTQSRYEGSDGWPILRATTADPARKTVVKGLDGDFRKLSVGALVQIWGKIQTVDGPSRPDAVTVTVSKIAPFGFLPERAEALKYLASASAALAKLEAAYRSIANHQSTTISPSNYVNPDGEVVLVQIGMPKYYAAHIDVANKHPEYREAVLRFNRFTPTVLDWPKVANALSVVQARIQNARFLNEKKERDDVRTLAAKLEKAVADANRQQKDLDVIHHYFLERPDPWPAFKYSELLPQVRAETDKDKYAFTPFPVKDRKNRPPATPHPDANKAAPTPPQPKPQPKQPPSTKGTTFEGKRYQVCTDVVSWHVARERCEQQGGRLAIVTSQKQNQFLTKLVLDAGLKEAWLGATDEKNEGVWLWVDGSPMNYKNWGSGQPNNTGKREHYLLLWAATRGEWSDQPDTANASVHRPGYICEWESGSKVTLDAFQAGSVWIGDILNHKLTVLERNGDTYRARFTSSAFDWEVTGTVRGGKVSWLGKDVRVIKGVLSGDNDGTIKGDTIDFVWRDSRGGSGRFTLRLKRDP